MYQVSLTLTSDLSERGAEVVKKFLLSSFENHQMMVQCSMGALIEANARLDWQTLMQDGRWRTLVRDTKWQALMRDARRPIVCRVMVFPNGHGSRVYLSAMNGDKFLIDRTAAASTYGPLLARVADRVGADLRELCPAAAISSSGDIQLLPKERGNPSLLHAVAKAYSGTGTSSIPLGVFGLDNNEVTYLEPGEAALMLMVGAMVSADTSLPQSLVATLYSVQERIWSALKVPNASRVLRLDTTERRVLNFLFSQARIRRDLPIRELRICRDCGNQRLVNPDYQKRVARSKGIQSAVGATGSVLMYGPMSPFFIAARFINSHTTPDETCPRCQGNRLDSSLATICPKCQTITASPVLRLCIREECEYDFRRRDIQTAQWKEIAPINLEEIDRTGSEQQEFTSRNQETARDAADHSDSEAVISPASMLVSGGGNREMQSTSSTVFSETLKRTTALTPVPDPGWYPDPASRHQWRWFSTRWTSYVSDGEGMLTDEL